MIEINGSEVVTWNQLRVAFCILFGIAVGVGFAVRSNTFGPNTFWQGFSAFPASIVMGAIACGVIYVFSTVVMPID
jgi:hypothetical protein